MSAKKANKSTKTKKRKATKPNDASMPVTATRSVRMEKASNGFTVSAYIKDREVTYIAKTKKEAMAYATSLFNKF